MSPFKLALIQMLVQGGNKIANLNHADRMVGEAVRAGAQVVLLPEAFDLGWTHPSVRAEASPIPGGDVFERLRKLAVAHKIYLCAGLTEKDGSKVFNSAILLGPQGELLLCHRKLN